MPAPYPPPSPRPHVKICGIRRVEDALLALELGAAFLGLILTPKSRRYLSLEDAKELARTVRAMALVPVRLVGVFVREPAEEIALAIKELDLVAAQVHGDSEAAANFLGAARVIPAQGIATQADAAGLLFLDKKHPAVLADAHSHDATGGTGRVFEHQLVQPLFTKRPVFLAGGLGPQNIAEVIENLGAGPLPYAIDLSSGVEESPGVKSHEKLRDFFQNYHRAMAARSQ